MNTTPQLDHHPDAESLSAFAEHQIPEHERQPILAHLATCARCRQVLFLAQDADPVEADVESAGQESHSLRPAVLPAPIARRKPLADWRFTWGALAACALLATLSIVFYPRHTASAPEQAKNLPLRQIPASDAPAASGSLQSLQTKPPIHPPAAISQPARPEAQSAETRELRLAPPPAAIPSLDRAAKPIPQPKPAQPVAAPPTVAVNSVLPAQQTEQTVDVSAAAQPLAQTGTQPLPPASTTQTVTVTADTPITQPSTQSLNVTMSAQKVEPSDQLPLKSRSIKSFGALHSAPKAVARSGGTGPAAGGVVGSASGAATASAPAKSPAAFAKMPPRPLVITPEDETAARVTLHKTLPSGLPAVAATSASHHLLAIDSAGTLFLSEDSGVVWEPIPQPWTGHATELRFSPAAPGPPAAIAGAAPADAASGAAYAPLPAFFEIVTESGIHWTSTDGRTWKTK